MWKYFLWDVIVIKAWHNKYGRIKKKLSSVDKEIFRPSKWKIIIKCYSGVIEAIHLSHWDIAGNVALFHKFETLSTKSWVITIRYYVLSQWKVFQPPAFQHPMFFSLGSDQFLIFFNFCRGRLNSGVLTRRSDSLLLQGSRRENISGWLLWN